MESEGCLELVPFISYQSVDQVILRYGEENISHNVDHSIVSLQINLLHLLSVDSDESLNI